MNLQHLPTQRPVRLPNKLLSGIQIAAGTLIGMVSAPCLILFFIELLTKGNDEIAINAFFVVLMGLGTALSAGLIYWGVSRLMRLRLPPQLREQQVLQAAQQRAGVLTVASLAVDSGFDTKIAQRALDALTRTGVAVVSLDDEGGMLYRFPGLVSGGAHPVSELDSFDARLGHNSAQQFDFDSDGAQHHANATHMSHHNQKK